MELKKLKFVKNIYIVCLVFLVQLLGAEPVQAQFYQGTLGLFGTESLRSYDGIPRLIGTLKLEGIKEGRSPVHIVLKNVGDDEFALFFLFKLPDESQALNLYFLRDPEPYAVVPGYLLGRFRHGLKFVGGMVLEEYRGKGFFKAMMKVFFALADDLRIPFVTERLRKPTFCSFFTSLGFVPQHLTKKLLLDRENRLEVYPVGFLIDERLVEGQRLTVLDSPPSEATSVFVDAAFVPPQNELSQIESILQLPGEITLGL